jgi:hypothetical protein
LLRVWVQSAVVEAVQKIKKREFTGAWRGFSPRTIVTEQQKVFRLAKKK